ncbi:hypothetical protein Tco_1114644 [Tanacetum coccineum]|uniref:Uncharacterized protein n=1 Tax=Tanacetum coccineum TaxID=301880 RepID=A0ABQ5IW31_9ASTR
MLSRSQYLRMKILWDKGVAETNKERQAPEKKNDADRYEDSPAGPDQRLKRKKTSKDVEPSKKVKSTDTSKGTTKSHPKSTGKSAQAEKAIVKADPKDWLKKLKRPPTPDPEWNTCKTVDDGPTQNWLSDLAKAEKPSKMFND